MSEGISYNNKDIIFKILSQFYKDKAFNVYGLHYPKIKEMLPNEFPQVTADEKRADTVFLLEDDSILLLEYESNSRFKYNMLKYMDYILRIQRRYLKEKNILKQIRVAVIYSSDVSKATSVFKLGSILFNLDIVYMADFDGDELYNELKNKLAWGVNLNDQDKVNFILLPLMRTLKNRQDVIEKSIELAKTIENVNDQLEIIAGILVSSDKVINSEYAKKIKEWIKLTQVGRLFEEEKEKAVKENAIEIAKNLLKNAALSAEEIAKNVGLTVEEVKKIKQNL
ncbi:MAG: transcriptional regulator [Clostridium tyrobutyricum]|jgi:hypothetical protein|uniref:transcriptional regulator n=1 Tax=Clostridium tyrobutyricum TaxID=1519 RepID=UPI0011CA3497|nr:transcriptional regulator [Clostridium tyrobutyricum]MCH4200658.1 transcriptional regulator [Clostridium tyrobutyricum]MCH4237556.1 transcriptional regulator [Clostridium tyrobutyricum]MCH4260133.1 transcriptional regulator [Clostridium tyrobutyricum]MCI2011757.1 transcriptional regulator [Clostridium tyrobutyricum]